MGWWWNVSTNKSPMKSRLHLDHSIQSGHNSPSSLCSSLQFTKFVPNQPPFWSLSPPHTVKGWERKQVKSQEGMQRIEDMPIMCKALSLIPTITYTLSGSEDPEHLWPKNWQLQGPGSASYCSKFQSTVRCGPIKGKVLPRASAPLRFLSSETGMGSPRVTPASQE